MTTAHDDRGCGWRLVRHGLLAALIVGLLGTLIVAGSVRLVERRAATLLRQEAAAAATTLGHALGRQFSHAVDIGIPLNQIPAVPAYLRTMLSRIPSVQWVVVRDGQGHELYAAGARQRVAAVQVERVSVPIRRHGNAIGSVQVMATAASVGATLSWLYRFTVLAVLIAAIVSGVLVAGLVYRGLVLPERSLRSALERVAGGDFGLPQAAAGNDITVAVFRALTGFCERVNDCYRDLAARAAELRAIDFDGSLARRIDAVVIPLQQRFQFVAGQPHPAVVPARRRRWRNRLLLRGRITLLVMLAALLLCTGLGLLGLQRERLLDERYAEVAIGGQSALWHQVVTAEVARLRALIPGLRHDVAALRVISDSDRGSVASVVDSSSRQLLERGALDELQIVTPGGTVLYSTAPSLDNRRILDAGSLARVAGGADRSGLYQASPGRYLLAVSFPLRYQGRVVGIGTVAVRVRRALLAFAKALGAPSLLVNLRGRLITATDTRFRGLLPRVPLRDASSGQISHGGRLYTVTGVPVSDLNGDQVGLVVTVRDSSASLGQARRITTLFLVGVGGFLLLVLVGLYGYLRRAFRPLEEGIDVLRALARGDTTVTLESTRQDEIGRIAEAVHGFRRELMALADSRRRQERQRRRQERFIRQQMTELAASLDADARQGLLATLQQARVPDAATNGGNGTLASSDIRQDDQLGLLAAVLQRLSGQIVDQHSRLADLVAELREALATKTQLLALQRELAIARQVQQAILPRDFPQRPEFAIHADMEPAREVGGDFYDFFAVGGDSIAVVVADVSDKGVPAALFMAVTRTLLKATALYERSPAACISQLNDLLAAENEQMMFVTLFYGLLHLPTGRLTYVNAGHNPPYVVSPAGKLAQLPGTGGIAVAVLAGHHYQGSEYLMNPGDTLFLYTDGVTEAFSADGEEFGESRLEALLAQRVGSVAVAEIAGLVGESVKSFADGVSPSDDMTCLSLRYLGIKQ